MILASKFAVGGLDLLQASVPADVQCGVVIGRALGRRTSNDTTATMGWKGENTAAEE